MSEQSDNSALRRRRRGARRLALQALYQWQLSQTPAGDIVEQFAGADDYPDVDQAYFAKLVRSIIATSGELDAQLGEHADRPVSGLDPVEHAVLWIGAYELGHVIDVPYRVAINEAVELAKRFGATDGHKYVNALLDKAARSLRSLETRRG